MHGMVKPRISDMLFVYVVVVAAVDPLQVIHARCVEIAITVSP